MDVAMNPDVLIAWSMNGTDIPMLNGYPLKLVVPGYFGTYWVKHLSAINVLDAPFTGHDAFFMTTAYRVPDNDCLCVAPGSVAANTVPISRLKVRSFITSLSDDAVVKVGRHILLKGLAFDGGTGIKTVAVSSDDGVSWREAELGKNLGRYSFRDWSLPFVPEKHGAFALKVRATSIAGETQPIQATWNPGGYARNVVETVRVTAV
jgi:sulfite dehydrogenase (cytochrome) subunit A